MHKHVKSPFQNFSIPGERFQTVHMDIVGPLPSVQNIGDPYNRSYRYLLTMIDRATRWVEVQPLTEITAKTVAYAFVTAWVSRL